MSLGKAVGGILGAAIIYKAADTTISMINRGCKKKKKKWRIW